MHPKAIKSGNPLKVRKGAWDSHEDSLLRKCIEKHGEGKWHLAPHRAGLNRCRKSCRLRWLNYLRPTIKRGDFSVDEVDLMVRVHKLLGNRWTLIAGRLPGRTGNDVKNFWNTNFKSKSTPVASNYPKEVEAKGKELINMKRKQETNGHTSSVTSDDHVVIKPIARTLLKETSVLCHDLNLQKHMNSPLSPGEILSSNIGMLSNKPLAELPPDDEGIEWWNTLLGEELGIHAGQEDELEEWLKESSDGLVNKDDRSVTPAIIQENSQTNGWNGDFWDRLNYDNI